MEDRNNGEAAQVPDDPKLGTTPDFSERNWSAEEREQLLLREQEARLVAEVMRDANLALTQNLSLETVLETLLNCLSQILPYDTANVMLRDETSQFVVTAARGYEGFLVDPTVAEASKLDTNTNAILRTICSTKRSVLVADTEKEPAWQRLPASKHIRSWIGVPLVVHDKVIGLYSLDKSQPGYFTAEHVRRAELLAAQATNAIQNAQLFEQVERYATGLEQRIAERKRAEEARREAEQKYRDIFENASEGIFQSTPEGRFLVANPALARMHGFDSPEDLIHSRDDISRQIYADSARRDEFKRLLEENGIVRGFEHQVLRKDGSKIWVSVNAHAVRDAQGGIQYYEGTVQDITDRKRAEARSAAFATLARKLSGARTRLDAGRIVAQTAGDLFGWDSCDLNLYDADGDLVHPMLNVDTIDGRQTDVTASISDRKPTARGRRVIDHGPELLLREEPIQFDEDAIPFGDISRPSASIMTVPIRHAARVIGLLSIQSYTPHSYDSAALADLEALADHCGAALNRIRVEESLFESKERFRQMADHFEDVVWITDREITKLLYINPAYEKVFGRSCESMYERLTSFSEAVHPEDRAIVERMLEDQKNGDHHAFEYRIVHPDGSVRWIQTRSFPIRNNEGEVYLVAGIAQDITERKQAEAALRGKSEELDRYFNDSLDLLCIAGTDGYFRRLNPEWERTLGYSLAELEGRRFLDFVHPDDVAATLAALRKLSSQECVLNFINRYRHQDGSYRWIEWRSYPADDVIYAVARDITERKQAEEKVQSLARFPSENPSPVLRLGRDGMILHANSASRLLLQDWGCAVGDRAPLFWQQEASEALASQTNRTIDVVCGDITFSIFVTPIVEADYVNLYGLDITERKRAEEALRQSEVYFRSLIEHAADTISTYDANGVRLYTSPSIERVLGYKPGEMIGRSGFELLHPDDRPFLSSLFAQAVQIPDTTVTKELRCRHKDGTWRTLESTGSNLLGNPAVGAVVLNSRDITERRRAEEALRDSEERYRDLVENSHELICTHDLEGKILSANHAATQLLGYDPNEFIGNGNIRNILAPEVRHQFDEYMARVCKDGATSGTMLVQTSSGERRVWEYYNSLRTEGVATPIVRGMARDITEQRRAEKALRESEERYRELFENAKDAIYVHDLSGRYTAVNRAAEQLSGFTREEILGKHYSNFVLPRDLKHVRTNLCRKLDLENETIYEVDMVTRTGRRVPVEVSSRLIFESGVAVGVQGVARDITDRKRAQEALRTYSQRLIEAQEAERQNIARELHDEIGQVLTAVRINLQSMQRSGGTNEDVLRLDESISVVDEALGRVGDLSIELRPSLLDDLGLTAAIRWYVDRYAQRTGIIAEVLDGFEVDGRLPRELETACFRIAQEALTNVARHAQAASVSVQLERSRGKMLLTVIDDGVGFDVDKLRKSASAAAALGLRGMEERALAVGGFITIDSGVERGTRIRATFPFKLK